MAKNLPANTGDVRDTSPIPGQENPLELEMATHSSSCLGNPMDRGDWWATVYELEKQSDET